MWYFNMILQIGKNCDPADINFVQSLPVSYLDVSCDHEIPYYLFSCSKLAI